MIDIFSEVLKVDEGEKRTLKDTIESIEKFNSIIGNHGNFQILACTVDKNQQVSVILLGCYFQSTEITDNYFFAGRKEQNIALQTSAEVFVLNQDVYDQVRDEVNQKLSNRVKHFISNINL